MEAKPKPIGPIRSTASALADVTQSWVNSTDNICEGRKGIHAVFLDFSKAFDLVDRGTSLAKLASTNICLVFWEWIRSFLSNRTQQVKLPVAFSKITSCPAGVSQGSVNTPSLFSVLVNDLKDAIPRVRDSIGVCKYGVLAHSDTISYISIMLMTALFTKRFVLLSQVNWYKWFLIVCKRSLRITGWS